MNADEMWKVYDCDGIFSRGRPITKDPEVLGKIKPLCYCAEEDDARAIVEWADKVELMVVKPGETLADRVLNKS